MKKKLFVFLLSALLVLSGCAAAKQAGNTIPKNTDADITVTALTAETSVDSFMEVPFSTQYIYTGSCAEATFPDVRRIDSREALEEYYQQNKDLFALDINYDNTPGFWETCKGYDETFFQEQCLVMVLLEEGSGSNRHEVWQVRREADGTLSISIDTLVPECGTCDMAQWHILLELPRAYVPESTDRIMLFWNGRLAWHGTPIRPGPQIDSSRMSSPPDGMLYHSGGSAPLLKGGFSWSTTEEDGTVCTLIADALHPLQCGDLLTPVTAEGDYVKLDFDEMPNSISVRCWPDSELDAEAIPEGVTVPCEGTTFQPLSGGYVYEITATWSENGRLDYGTATYIVHLIWA